MKRTTQANLAQETLLINAERRYIAPSGQLVDLSASIDFCLQATLLITPGDWRGLIRTAQDVDPFDPPASIDITREPTLQAMRRVGADGASVGALNFASANSPGGGFLNGATAQEESLARSSALHASLTTQFHYYTVNRSAGAPYYTDHAILSPRVPFYRNDAGELLEEPYEATILTMPAPNLRQADPELAHSAKVTDILKHRINCVLALAASEKIDHLVLGAWGCGVFRNDPAIVARLFTEALSGPDSWRPYFSTITFAIYDPAKSSPNLPPFEKAFQSLLAADT